MSKTKNKTWEEEYNAVAFKYHSIVLWVAFVLNPLWAVGDYLTIPQHFTDFFVFRMAVSVACLITVFYREKFHEKPWVLAFVPFFGIGIQNAYMYSVMEIPELEKHTFAFIALFIGAGMLILWEMKYTIIVVAATIISSIFFFVLLSPLTTEEVLTDGGMLTATVAVFTIVLIQTRTNLTKKEIIARLALEESNKEIKHQKAIVDEQNKDIRDSIHYAQRIQYSMLPNEEKISAALENYFILYQPKDIVSGDFYWSTQVQTTPSDGSAGHKVAVLAVADCTGHGVPGALMSIVGSTILNQSITSKEVNSPAEALRFLNQELNKNLKDIRDGMDMSLIAINFSNFTMQYAGAHNPVYIVRNKEIIELKPDKFPIGNDDNYPMEKKFTDKNFSLEKGDIIYLFTDGYSDQFGHSEEMKLKAAETWNNDKLSETQINETVLSMLKGKKFGNKRFQQLLIDISHLPIKEQKEKLLKTHTEWKGELEQIDDICVIGVLV